MQDGRCSSGNKRGAWRMKEAPPPRGKRWRGSLLIGAVFWRTFSAQGYIRQSQTVRGYVK